MILIILEKQQGYEKIVFYKIEVLKMMEVWKQAGGGGVGWVIGGVYVVMFHSMALTNSLSCGIILQTMEMT